MSKAPLPSGGGSYNATKTGKLTRKEGTEPVELIKTPTPEPETPGTEGDTK